MTIEDFDSFRANYDDMSFSDMKEFYDRLKKDHPYQSHFDIDKVNAFFDALDIENVRVLELGGWDGELASILIEKYKIEKWVNYEICSLETRCRSSRYSAPPMDDFLWDMDVDFGQFNVFVASHVLEHLSDGHLYKMFSCIPHIRHIYVDMPPEVHHAGTTAAHVLEDSWNKVNGMLQSIALGA